MYNVYICNVCVCVCVCVCIYIYIYIKFIYLFLLFRAAPAAYEDSQARGQTGATAAGLHHSHGNAGSEPHL